NPKSYQNKVFLGNANSQLGESLAATNRTSEAMTAWSKSLEIASSIAGTGQLSPTLAVIKDSRNLAAAEAARGRKQESLKYAMEAWAKAGTLKNQPIAVAQASGTMGLTYDSVGDRKQAKDWLEKSSAQWRALKGSPKLREEHQAEIRKVEAALER